MNEVINLLFNRKSIRSFENKEISQKDKNTIFDSAIQAPTAGNQVLYTILEIDDQELKDVLAISCDNQPFIAKAPLVLIFLADCRRWYDCYKYAGTDYRAPGPGDLILACEDALIAAQNAVIAAESLGIGSCYIGDILENKEKIEKLLNINKYVFPVTMVVFGYPTEQQIKRTKPIRFDKKYIVQKNRYSPLSEKTLRKMYKERNGKADFNFDTWIKTFCNRKYMADFAIELNRSTKEYLENFECTTTNTKSQNHKKFNHDNLAHIYDSDVKNELDPVRKGYTKTLEKIINLANINLNTDILELGSGTGNLTSKINSCNSLICVDLSDKMEAEAAKKCKHLPNKKFIKSDILEFIHSAKMKFDVIISSYALHHLTENEKNLFLKKSAEVLNPNGRIIIGDLMFYNSSDFETAKTKYKDNKSVYSSFTEEYYWIADNTKKELCSTFKNIKIKKISELSSIIIFEK